MTCKWISEAVGIRYPSPTLSSLALLFNFRMQKGTARYSNTPSRAFVISSISIGMCSSGFLDLTWIVEACASSLTVGIFSLSLSFYAFGLMCRIEMCKLWACGKCSPPLTLPLYSFGTIRMATLAAMPSFPYLFVVVPAAAFLPVDVPQL